MKLLKNIVKIIVFPIIFVIAAIMFLCIAIVDSLSMKRGDE